jgi:hypothetical protein
MGAKLGFAAHGSEESSLARPYKNNGFGRCFCMSGEGQSDWLGKSLGALSGDDVFLNEAVPLFILAL